MLRICRICRRTGLLDAGHLPKDWGKVGDLSTAAMKHNVKRNQVGPPGARHIVRKSPRQFGISLWQCHLSSRDHDFTHQWLSSSPAAAREQYWKMVRTWAKVRVAQGIPRYPKSQDDVAETEQPKHCDRFAGVPFMLLESKRQDFTNLLKAYPSGDCCGCSCGLGLKTHMNVHDRGLRTQQISINLSMGLFSQKMCQCPIQYCQAFKNVGRKLHSCSVWPLSCPHLWGSN